MIWRAHDALTRVGFLIGSAALGGIVAVYLIEVVARYFFNSPTMWSASAVAYLLCVAVMLAMPELARTRGHIAISILEEKLPEKLQPHHIRLTAALAGIVCVVAAWMIWNESIRQWQSGITTTRGRPHSKILGVGLYLLWFHQYGALLPARRAPTLKPSLESINR